MTRDEFLDKLESEGEAYAFQEYGLSEDDLDEDLHGTPLYQAVRDARLAYLDAEAKGGRIYFAQFV